MDKSPHWATVKSIGLTCGLRTQTTRERLRDSGGEMALLRRRVGVAGFRTQDGVARVAFVKHHAAVGWHRPGCRVLAHRASHRDEKASHDFRIHVFWAYER